MHLREAHKYKERLINESVAHLVIEMTALLMCLNLISCCRVISIDEASIADFLILFDDCC
jgi:hypothetical protein